MRLAPLLFVFASLLCAPAAAQRETRIPEAASEVAATLRAQALADDTGYRLVESLTTEVGPRMGGTEADARAVRWAIAKFEALGYDRVYTEPVTFPVWHRGHERAAVLAPYPQPLTITALGGSVGSGGAIDAEIVSFPSLQALRDAPEGAARGKIAFIDNRMQRARDGSGYGPAVAARGSGADEAAKKGARAVLIRSIGTSNDRFAHTGVMRYAADAARKIPAAALSNPDADLLAAMLARGAPVTVRLDIDAETRGEYTSQNVIAEVAGRSRRDEVVVIAAHLDSWDLGTGAIDDGAGIGITMAAGHLIAKLPKRQRPARTIRVIAYANEEQGLHGGRAYAEKHAEAVERHAIAAESDFGAGRIYALRSNAPEYARAAIRSIGAALAPLGVETLEDGKGGPGPDLGPFVAKGLAWAQLAQDGTDYFDLHHTANDTFDKIDPQALAQNVAAYAVFAYLAASAEGDFGSRRKDAE